MSLVKRNALRAKPQFQNVMAEYLRKIQKVKKTPENKARFNVLADAILSHLLVYKIHPTAKNMRLIGVELIAEEKALKESKEKVSNDDLLHIARGIIFRLKREGKID